MKKIINSTVCLEVRARRC